jgi:hypothetical protein
LAVVSCFLLSVIQFFLPIPSSLLSITAFVSGDLHWSNVTLGGLFGDVKHEKIVNLVSCCSHGQVACGLGVITLRAVF